MNLVVLYFGLLLTFLQGGIFNSAKLNSESKFEIIEQIISQKPLATHHDFQNSIFVIDEENDDDVSSSKGKLIAKKLFSLTNEFSKLFSLTNETYKVKFIDSFCLQTSSTIYILNSVFRL